MPLAKINLTPKAFQKHAVPQPRAFGAVDIPAVGIIDLALQLTGLNDASITEAQTFQPAPVVAGGSAPYTFAWTGSGVTFSDAAIKQPVITPSGVGTFTLTLTVTDADGDTVSDSLSVTVTAAAAALPNPVNFAGNPMTNSQNVVGETTMFGFDVAKSSDYGFSAGPFIAYSSTEHSSGSGKIVATIGESPYDIVDAQGAIFQPGAQSETPEVFLDTDNTPVMLYQEQANGNQRTAFARADDATGLAWTRTGVALGNPTADGGQATHTGYAVGFVTDFGA